MTENARRDFLDPRRLLEAVTRVEQHAQSAVSAIEQAVSAPVLTFRKEAMACGFEIQVPKQRALRRAIFDAFDLIDRLEDQLTVYRDESEVSRINASAFLGPTPVEARLFRLLVTCQEWTTRSEGAFDITAGPLIRAWGFRRRQGRVPDAGEIATVLESVGMRNVKLDPQAETVQFLNVGTELNFGAIGKGYALDRVREQLHFTNVKSFLLSAGHSSIMARGKPEWDDAWRISIAHPMDINRTLATIPLRNQALATSGVTQQFFEQDGKRYGHLLDPRTGTPADGLLQVSAVANDATTAEALSTAMFINGVDWTRSILAENPNWGALLVLPDGEAVLSLGTLAGVFDGNSTERSA